jgi:membrane-bound metal-dependent hydrolase YbcI (DUF457 family)
MMGKAHMASGAAAFAVVGTGTASVTGLSFGQLITGMALCAGAAVLPDIDHPGSGVSRTFGPVTRGFAWVVEKVSGGHRNGTHSFLGTAVFTVLAFGATALHTRNAHLMLPGLSLASCFVGAGVLLGANDKKPKRAYKKRWHGWVAAYISMVTVASLALSALAWPDQAGSVALGALICLVLAAAIRILRIKGWVDDMIPIPIAIVVIKMELDVTVVPYAVVLGVLAHIAGDMVTLGGCPLAWPWSQKMMGPQLFRTGSWVETGPITIVCWLTVGAVVTFNAAAATGAFNNFTLT